MLVHSGSPLEGHYYALLKDPHVHEWHKFNDSTVQPIKESELTHTSGSGNSGGSAYLLLYRKSSQKPAACTRRSMGSTKCSEEMCFDMLEQHEADACPPVLLVAPCWASCAWGWAP